jgi:uroporphyrin-3 C-methyltransferase
LSDKNKNKENKSESSPDTTPSEIEYKNLSEDKVNATKNATSFYSGLKVYLIAGMSAILVLTIGFSIWVYDKSNNQKDLTNQFELLIKEDINRLVERADEMDSRVRESFAEMDKLRSKNVDLERKVLRQGSRLIQMGINPKDEWILAEALYLSRLATQRLLIERSSESAIALLLEADKLLLKFDDANLAHVRNALSKEIASLRTLNKIDAQGIIFELNAISEEVNKLSILNLLSTQKDTSKTDNKEEVENLENKKQLSLGNFFRNFGEQLEDAIKVRRFDSDIQPLITEHDLSVVRNNIDLHFQQAIYSVMREEKDLFELSLKNIVADLKNYFHMNPKSSNLLQRIQQISLLSIEQKLPKIGYSSELLNSYISARNEELLNSVTSKNSDY